jgi:cytosine permease
MSVEREEVILSKVPESERVGWVAPLFSILGCNVAVTELMVGGGLVAGLTVKNTIIASIIGNLILALIVYVQGKIGTREGLNTYVLTEMAFGKEGNKWVVSLLFAITLFGWFGIQDGLATLALQQIFPNINFVITAIILGILMTYFAAKGFHSVSWFNYILIPPLVILVLWGLIKTGKTYGLANIWSYVPEEPISLLSGINMVVGLIMCGAITSCDYTRYCKKSSDVAIVGLVGFMVISVFQQIGAAIIALSAPTWNIVEVLAQIGFNWVAFIILIGAAWSTNLVSAYSGGLALKNLFPKIDRYKLTILAGLIGTILAAMNIIQRFVDYLTLMGVIYGPIAGVLWVEYYFVKKQYIVDKSVNWPGVLCMFIGAIVSYVTSVKDVGISSINGLIVSFLVYYIYRVIIKKAYQGYAQTKK